MIKTASKNISKAQIEVWNWKESINNEIKNLEIKEGLKLILQKSKLSRLNFEAQRN